MRSNGEKVTAKEEEGRDGGRAGGGKEERVKGRKKEGEGRGGVGRVFTSQPCLYYDGLL